MVALQAPLSVGFSRQEYWTGLPCPPLGDLLDPEIKPVSLMAPSLAGGCFTTSTTWGAPQSPQWGPLCCSLWRPLSRPQVGFPEETSVFFQNWGWGPRRGWRKQEEVLTDTWESILWGRERRSPGSFLVFLLCSYQPFSLQPLPSYFFFSLQTGVEPDITWWRHSPSSLHHTPATSSESPGCSHCWPAGCKCWLTNERFGSVSCISKIINHWKFM